MIEFPKVLANDTEAEAFLDLIAGHLWNNLNAAGEEPSPKLAIALGQAFAAAMRGEPDE